MAGVYHTAACDSNVEKVPVPLIPSFRRFICAAFPFYALCRERELLLFQIPNQRLGVRSR
jgi:hypothetical protein